MARPEKNTVTYFPLDCEDGKKMYYIEETYGNDGFATFIKILRELARSEYHYLDLSKPTTMMFISSKCKVSKDKLEAIITDLVELEKFNRLLWEENKIIWCQDFINSIQDAYLKRKNKCIDFNGLLLLLIRLGVRKPEETSKKITDNTQIRTEEIKTDQKKSEETKPKKFNYKKELLNYVTNEVLVSDFISLRNARKASLGETAFNSLINECQDNDFPVEEALTISIEKNWIGFKVSWVKNIKKQNEILDGKSIATRGNSTSRSDDELKQSANDAVNAIYGISKSS